MNTTDRTLRSLDAAEAITDAQRERANATLSQVISTDPYASGASSDRPVTSRRRSGRRVAVIGTAAATLAAASILLPGMGNDSKAYATWTATATPLSAKDAQPIIDECRSQLANTAEDSHTVPGIQAGSDPVAIAERRGDSVAVMIRGAKADYAATCVGVNKVGSTDVDDMSVGIGGSDGPRVTPPPGAFKEGSVSQSGDDPAISMTEGLVGPGVTGVTIHAGKFDVEATVKDGYYVAWWPGPSFSDEPLPPSGEGGPTPFMTYDLTLSDGRVVKDAPSADPS
ncbi:MAG: hypothetical protein LWW86_04975 [Micrococcales bacterium]|nr:hypothetical protein [Micrococcales bacterium]